MNAPTKRLCPYCSSVEINRSHRRGAIERYFFRAIGMRPYRCSDCDARFYAFAGPHEETAPKAGAA